MKRMKEWHKSCQINSERSNLEELSNAILKTRIYLRELSKGAFHKLQISKCENDGFDEDRFMKKQRKEFLENANKAINEVIMPNIERQIDTFKKHLDYMVSR